MQSTLNDGAADNEAAWKSIQPLLDEALMTLRDKDRQALLLRYFQEKQLAEVAGALAVNEDAARKRIGRALDKLRKFFAKRGAALSITVIASALAANSVQAAPSGLAANAAAAALAHGSTTAASTIALVKAAMKLMTLTKIKTAAALGVALAFGVTTTMVATGGFAGEPALDDSVWMRMDTQTLNSLPPVFVLRPTQFAANARGFGGGAARSGNKMMGRALSLEALLAMAYEIDTANVEPIAGNSGERFDLIVTAADASPARLQEAIKDKLGYVAQKQNLEKDALALTYKGPAPGLRATADQAGRTSAGRAISGMMAASGGGGLSRKGGFSAHGQTIASIIKNLQGHFNRPIIDHTGLTGKYDVNLEWNGESAGEAIRASLPAQLGLELSDSREIVQTLLATKVK